MAQNLNTVAAIVLDEHLTIIKVKFQNPRTQQTHETLTFLCERQLAAQLSEKSLVLVETKAQDTLRLSVAEVMEIHDHAQVDPDDGVKYRYAFALVDRSPLDTLKAREESLVKRIKAARRETWRKQLLGDIDAQAVLAAPSTPVDLERKSPFTQVAEKYSG